MIRVLLADDHAIVRSGVKQLLQIAGDIEVTAEATNGAQVLQALRAEPFDLILLDMGMPGISGYDVARQVRSSSWGQRTRIVALTGWGNADDRVRSKEAGIDHLEMRKKL